MFFQTIITQQISNLVEILSGPNFVQELSDFFIRPMRGSIGDEILKMGFEGLPLCDKFKGQWFKSRIRLDCPCYPGHVELIQGHRLGTDGVKK